MGTINVSLPSDGETADAADYNTPITTIVNEINGELDNANIASDAAIAGSKLASGGVGTTQVADDAVTAAKIDWASTGANGGIWWEEIGRTTLGSAGATITVDSLPARKYLLVLYSLLPTGGTISSFITFNNDSGSNYAHRYESNFGGNTTATNQSNGLVSVATSANPMQATLSIVNIATQEKLVTVEASGRGAAGAGNAPQYLSGTTKWANTSDQISRIDLSKSGSGNYDTGSEAVVLGHN